MPISFGVSDIIVPGKKASAAPQEAEKNDYTRQIVLYSLGVLMIFLLVLAVLVLLARVWRARQRGEDYFEREWTAYKSRAKDAEHDGRQHDGRHQDVERAPAPAEQKRYRDTRPAWQDKKHSDFAKPSI